MCERCLTALPIGLAEATARALQAEQRLADALKREGAATEEALMAERALTKQYEYEQRELQKMVEMTEKALAKVRERGGPPRQLN